jgi:hypothetical protein
MKKIREDVWWNYNRNNMSKFANPLRGYSSAYPAGALIGLPRELRMRNNMRAI